MVKKVFTEGQHSLPRTLRSLFAFLRHTRAKCSPQFESVSALPPLTTGQPPTTIMPPSLTPTPALSRVPWTPTWRASRRSTRALPEVRRAYLTARQLVSAESGRSGQH
eukprot:m.2979 g.2979  ORF g.2979 m.2979 type:complete len:108 (-) comp1944_c0_seq1:1873-2196(-)